MNHNISQEDQGLTRTQSTYYTINEFNSKFITPETISDSHDNRRHYQRGTDLTEFNPKDSFSLFHWNARSLNKNFESLELLFSSINHFPFSVIGISETWLRFNSTNLT